MPKIIEIKLIVSDDMELSEFRDNFDDLIGNCPHDTLTLEFMEREVYNQDLTSAKANGIELRDFLFENPPPGITYLG